MNKYSPLHLVVAAALFGVAAESAWSEEAASEPPAAPAEQTAAPVASDDPGYAPAPYQGGYEPYWQPPPRPAPPPGYYGYYPPYQPPYPQYRSAPAAPAENPLSAELTQAQEQLVAKETELSTASEQLTAMQAEKQAILEVMQQAQAEYAKASEQLTVVIEEMDILHEVLSKLKGRLDIQNTSLLGAVGAGAAKSEPVDSPIAGGAEPAAAPAAASVQPESTGGGPIEARENEPAQPEAK